VTQPRYADSFPDLKAFHSAPALDHFSNDLVAGDQRQFRMGKLAIDDVQIGSTDPARANPDQQLSVVGTGYRRIGEPERPARCIEQHGFHERYRPLALRA
jgi:hypothetical protein